MDGLLYKWRETGERGKRVEGNVGHKRSFVGMVDSGVSTMLSLLWSVLGL